ncbi:hypothetical protein ACFO0N_07200 [Halobium salinum]|uniref:Uncharacterized protein n=1 Tax=Halobium salinum TaxID=1364940 RepID=A0ABD5PAH4_9EURY|nr:hypothetical protein [Halobium salinum]
MAVAAAGAAVVAEPATPASPDSPAFGAGGFGEGTYPGDGGSGDDDSGSDDGSGRDPTEKGMSVVGSGNWTAYEFTTSGSITPGDNVEADDSSSDSRATGTVEYMSDNYSFEGEMTSFTVVAGDPDVDIWIQGEKYAPSDFPSDTASDLPERRMSVVGSGNWSAYEFTAEGRITSGDNVEDDDSVTSERAKGNVEYMSDNYTFEGDMTSFTVVAGDPDVDIWIEGRKYAPSDFPSDPSGELPEREMSVVGTGNPTEYEFTAEGAVTPADNVESDDSVSSGRAEGSVEYMSDNYTLEGDMTSFTVVSGDPDVAIWIEGRKYAPSDF